MFGHKNQPFITILLLRKPLMEVELEYSKYSCIASFNALAFSLVVIHYITMNDKILTYMYNFDMLPSNLNQIPMYS